MNADSITRADHRNRRSGTLIVAIVSGLFFVAALLLAILHFSGALSPAFCEGACTGEDPVGAGACCERRLTGDEP